MPEINFETLLIAALCSHDLLIDDFIWYTVNLHAVEVYAMGFESYQNYKT